MTRIVCLASKTTNLTLWILLLAWPIFALMALGAEGNPLTLLGGIRVNEMPWIAASSLAKFADWGDVHKFLGNVIMWISGLHAFAALYHHFKLKDGVLVSMLR